MTVVNALPNRPLRRAEVNALETHEKIKMISPIYGQRPEFRDTARGLVVKLGTNVIAIGYRDGEWTRIETREVTAGEGVPFEQVDILEDLQETVMAHINGD